MNKKRFLIWFCILIVICTPLISVLTCHHDCTGEECFICYFIEITKDALVTISVTVFIDIVRLIYSFVADIPKNIFYKNANLILQGVKLSA